MAAIPLARVRWRSNDELEFALAQACGDIVQAIQALKESRPCPTEHLRDRLLSLSSVIDECESYSVSNNLHFLFVRAQLQVNDVLRLIFPEVGPKACRFDPVEAACETNDDVKIALHARLEYVELGSLKVPRIFNGLWQLSSPAWGSASLYKQHKALRQLVSVGLVATDMADHYVSYSAPVRQHFHTSNPFQGDAELLYGSFRNQLPPQISATVIACSKWCVFRAPDKPITAEFVLEAVMERSIRVGGRVELLQVSPVVYQLKPVLVS